MTMNLNEESRYVVNRDEDLTVVDSDGDVSLAEKKAIQRQSIGDKEEWPTAGAGAAAAAGDRLAMTKAAKKRRRARLGNDGWRPLGCGKGG
ncbi:hypothetical protein BHM03_00045483 [Ensete ventricosum]|nr:hypothetical protein BHM03_00045483 [Ensete ventricosum]